jgi:hypothetical protein
MSKVFRNWESNRQSILYPPMIAGPVLTRRRFCPTMAPRSPICLNIIPPVRTVTLAAASRKRSALTQRAIGSGVTTCRTLIWRLCDSKRSRRALHYDLPKPEINSRSTRARDQSKNFGTTIFTTPGYIIRPTLCLRLFVVFIAGH